MSTAFETKSEFAVVLLTQDGAIVDAHPTCFESLGWAREELVGKDIGELLQSDREILMTQLIQSKDQEVGIDGQTSFSIRILARRRDETSFPARVIVRRFDQTECCTVAFYRVTPHNDSDTPPVVRPEEIELAMRGNSAGVPSAQPKLEKPKSRWRNARLLFGSKPSPSAAAAPSPTRAPVPAQTAPVASAPPARALNPPLSVPAQRPQRQIPQFDPQVPEDIFLRNVPASQPEKEVELEPPLNEAVAASEEPSTILPPSRNISSEPPRSETLSDDNLSFETLARELEQEREERRRLEERAAALTAQVSALHRQVGDNLEIESHNQKKTSTLEEQLRDSRHQVTQLKSDLAAERQKTNGAQEKVDAANNVSTKLSEELEALKLVHEALSRTQSEMENQLQAVSRELSAAQEALTAETAKRTEKELTLSAEKQARAEQERKLTLEISKLETALKTKELELKQVETKNAQAELQAKS